MQAITPHVLLLIRHGQSQANLAGNFQGQLDSELSPLGIEQGKKLSLHLANYPLKAIYASPLKRAHVTADFVNENHHLPLHIHPGLKELDVGDLANKPYEVAQTEFPGFLDDFKKNHSTVRFPAGETLTELQDRALAAITEIRSQQENEGMLAIVSHNICLRALTIGLLGWHWDALWQLALDSAGLSMISFGENGRAVLVTWNQTAHLGSLPKFKPSGLLGL